MSELLGNIPNMNVIWQGANSPEIFDLVLLDWFCSQDCITTYWSMNFADHDPSESNPSENRYNLPFGYAGFQTLYNTDTHKLIYSMWETGDYIPEVEYVSPLVPDDDLIFGGEGNGKRIFTNYHWKVNTWYTIAIGAKCNNSTNTEQGKTYYYQWIKEKYDPKAEWFLCGIISFPLPNRNLSNSHFFQENFGSANNQRREFGIKNICGHYVNNSQPWKTFGPCSVTNDFYSHTDGTGYFANIHLDCGASLMSDTNGNYINVWAGGETITEAAIAAAPKGQPILSDITFECQTPTDIPLFAPLPPRYIKHNSKYIIPNANDNDIILSTDKYYWFFIDTTDGYTCIVNSDRSKAISVAYNYTITLSTFDENNISDWQKWKISSYPQSDKLYFKPKINSNVGLYVYNDTSIALTAFDSTANKFKFNMSNKAELKNVKNLYSNLYVNPYNSNIVQNNNTYKWNFVTAEIKSGVKYFYILTTDNTKAITANSKVNGANLSFTDFQPFNENQKWMLMPVSNNNSNIVYIVPKDAETLTIALDSATTNPNTSLKLKTQSSAPQYKWSVNDTNYNPT